MREHNNKKVYMVSLLFTVLVGFSFIFAKMGVTESSPLILATYRFNFAIIAVIISIVFGLIKIDLKAKPIKKVVVMSLYYAAFILLQAIGLLYASSIEAGIIFALVPILTMIIASFILKEYTNTIQKLFVTMSVSGVLIMVLMGANAGLGGPKLNILGIVILFASSLSLAISNVIMRKLRGLFTPSEISAVSVTMCFFMINAIFIIVSIKNGNLGEYFRPLFNVNFLVSAIFLGVTCTFITSLLISYMLAHMEAYKATLFGNLSTAISIIVGVLVAKEPFELYHIVGTGLIIFGVLGTTVYISKIKKTQKS